MQYKPLLLVGPSGVGKMTLIDAVLSNYGDLFERKRSVTTRPTRQIEKAEKNFIFKTPEEFSSMKKANAFIECREK